MELTVSLHEHAQVPPTRQSLDGLCGHREKSDHASHLLDCAVSYKSAHQMWLLSI